MAIAAGPSTPGAVSPSRVRFAVACDTYQAVTLKPAAAARKRWPGSLDHRPALDTAPGGRLVTGEIQGWQFRVDVIPADLRISASAPGGGDPAVWGVAG
jgi:hypothetical protein